MTGVDLDPFLARDFRFARVEPQRVQDRGADVGHVMAVFHRVETDFAGGAVHGATVDPTPAIRTGKP